MPESAEEVYARVVAQVGVDGHLPMPAQGGWDIFPWEGTGLRPRVVEPPSDEPPRHGEGDRNCSCTGSPAKGAIWANDRWEVRAPGQPGGLPLVVNLCPLEHLDFEDLDDDMAAEFGLLSVWLHRIISRMPNIGRVHVQKIGDGSAHLHAFFIARTARMTNILGSPAVDWDEILPAVPEDIWRADLAYVAKHLATHGGTALV
ncbi:MAG: hypothetical protein JWR35_655 [Marmoricola sp.]|nr:hypothetical protein [Marmoricola sp.]